MKDQVNVYFTHNSTFLSSFQNKMWENFIPFSNFDFCYWLEFVFMLINLLLDAPLWKECLFCLSLPTFNSFCYRVALQVVQRTLRKYMNLRLWAWYRLWQKIKPLLNVTRIEDDIKVSKEKVFMKLFRKFN